MEYALHRAEFWEFDILFEKYWNDYKTKWEHTRFIAYVIAQTQSKKKLKFSDILKFDWDSEEKTTEKISIETKENLINKMKQIELQLNNTTNNIP